MKISKHIHSCLLVQYQEKYILIDPGMYTYDYQGLDLNTIPQLDYVLITHQHPDHLGTPLIKETMDKFPNARVISNLEVANILNKEKIPVATNGDSLIVMEEAVHEKVFGSEPPVNTVFKIGGVLTHPGDTFHLQSSTPILALPVQAPWGSTNTAVEMALALKPKKIIPIHDWHWNDVARDNMYARLEKFFGERGIEFISMETGKVVEV